MRVFTLFTTTILLAVSTFASEELSPSVKYTCAKNSSYIDALEKRRSTAINDRDQREQVRAYQQMKQAAQK